MSEVGPVDPQLRTFHQRCLLSARLLPLYPQLRTFHPRCLLSARLLPLYPQLRTWVAPQANVSVRPQADSTSMERIAHQP